MKIILFGCGQGGQMVPRWIPPSHEILAYSDNNSGLWGQSLNGIPVISPEMIPVLSPDLVWITILNREAADSIRNQLQKLGYKGEIQELKPLRRLVDLRLSHLRLLSEEIRQRNLPGAIAELGVYRGETAAELNRLFPERPLYLFDTFDGFCQSDLEIEKKETDSHCGFFRDFKDTSAEQVKERLPHPEQAIFCVGHFPETLPADLPDLALVSLDPDLYEPVWQGLCAFWPRLVPGGIILIHDYNSTQFPGVGKAVRRFCALHNLMVLPLSDLHGSAVLLKQS